MSVSKLTDGDLRQKLFRTLLWAESYRVPIRFLLDVEEGIWLDTGDQVTLNPNGITSLTTPDGEEMDMGCFVGKQGPPCSGTVVNLWLERTNVTGF